MSDVRERLPSGKWETISRSRVDRAFPLKDALDSRSFYRMENALARIEDGLNRLSEQTEQTRRETREDSAYLRTRIDDIDGRLGDPASGLGALGAKIDGKPGRFAVGASAIAIVVAVSGVIVFADQLRAMVAG